MSEATMVEQPKALFTSEVYYYRYLCEQNKYMAGGYYRNTCWRGEGRNPKWISYYKTDPV